MSNVVKKVLRITDENLVIDDVSYETFHKQNTLVIHATLSLPPFTRKNCHTHCTAQSYFVRSKQSTANQVKFKVIDLLKEQVSLSLIAKLTIISITTVIRMLKELPTTLEDEFLTKLQTLFRFEEGIRNAMIYPYYNGKIEAKNTHIKTLKRISYGFKSFENMKIRIFLNNGLIELT